MLRTNLDHLETPEAMKQALESNENVMICCGRMGPMCLPVYAAMEKLRDDYPNVAFFDQDFDGPAAGYIRSLPLCAGFMGLPFTVYFRNGEPVDATTSIQRVDQIKEKLDSVFVQSA